MGRTSGTDRTEIKKTLPRQGVDAEGFGLQQPRSFGQEMQKKLEMGDKSVSFKVCLKTFQRSVEKFSSFH